MADKKVKYCTCDRDLEAGKVLPGHITWGTWDILLVVLLTYPSFVLWRFAWDAVDPLLPVLKLSLQFFYQLLRTIF
jgi:hypothetical protein